jgi:hypothetical protein
MLSNPNPEELKREKTELRNDIRDTALNIIFKIAEKSAVYLNPVFILNHILVARVEGGVEDFRASIVLDNGISITAIVTPQKSLIEINSIVRCDCVNICEE